MFDHLKVKELKNLVSTYRKYHNIRGYSKMKKAQLISELNKRFIIQNGQLILKAESHVSKEKKRITPVFVDQLPTEKTQPFGSMKQKIQSNAEKRVMERAKDLENYYSSRGNEDKDEYPEYAF